MNTMCVQAAVSEILAVFLNFHIWAWNMEFEETSQRCICTRFLPHGGRHSAYFRPMGSRFRDTGRFSKLPYLGVKPGIWKKCQKLHMDPLSTPVGRNWAYFCSTDNGFRDTGWFSKLPYLGMKPGIWKKCRKLHMDLLSTPGDRNWAHFHCTGSRFRDRAI